MLNEITLHGYLGRDPELTEQQGQNGPYKRAAFSLGVSRDYGDATDWFYCVLYGKRAEVVDKYFRKGSQILVTGRMESYHPKDDEKKTNWLVKVSGFDFCDKANGSNAKQSAPAQGDNIPEGFTEYNDDDVPF